VLALPSGLGGDHILAVVSMVRRLQAVHLRNQLGCHKHYIFCVHLNCHRLCLYNLVAQQLWCQPAGLVTDHVVSEITIKATETTDGATLTQDPEAPHGKWAWVEGGWGSHASACCSATGSPASCWASHTSSRSTPTTTSHPLLQAAPQVPGCSLLR
jgi:hypothetical protein